MSKKVYERRYLTEKRDKKKFTSIKSALRDLFRQPSVKAAVVRSGKKERTFTR